jgi:hypothetical protein
LPDIAVAMLDGPPWASHPEALDEIHFDDLVRAAVAADERPPPSSSDNGSN